MIARKNFFDQPVKIISEHMTKFGKLQLVISIGHIYWIIIISVNTIK